MTFCDPEGQLYSPLWLVPLLPSGPSGPLAGPEGTSEFLELEALGPGEEGAAL